MRAVEPRETRPGGEQYVRSYVLMRLAVGVLGVAVPILLIFGEPAVFDGQPFPRGSLSAYYYSGVREVFVGALCAMGVFLVTYKIAVRSWESWLSTLAGLVVIVVAVFPTGRPGDGVPLTPLQNRLSETTVEWIHFGAAAVFIVSLAAISYVFATTARANGRRSRSFWRAYHLACAGVIVAALILAAVRGLVGWPDKGLLIAEAVAVWAFGASWLMKGLDLDVLRSS